MTKEDKKPRCPKHDTGNGPCYCHLKEGESDKEQMPDIIDNLYSNIQSIYDTDGWYVDEDGEGSNTPCVALQSALAAVEEFETEYNAHVQQLIEHAVEKERERCVNKADEWAEDVLSVNEQYYLRDAIRNGEDKQ